MKKEVSIRRRETKSHLPPEVVANSKKRLGSMYVGQGPLRGVEGDEEKKLLSKYLGINPDSLDFERETIAFWAELVIDVPSEGIQLNVTKDGKGEPVAPLDYIKYRWAIKHKLVAESREEMIANPYKQFYIYDPEEEIRKSNSKVQEKLDAYSEFLKVKKDEKKMGRLIRLLGNANPDRLTLQEKENMLDTLVTNEPAKFAAIARDKNLDIRAEIEEMVSKNILRKIGNQVYYIDDKIGDTTDDAILYFKDSKNSSTITTLKAKLEELNKTL